MRPPPNGNTYEATAPSCKLTFRPTSDTIPAFLPLYKSPYFSSISAMNAPAMLIAQSGGPSMVINQSLVGAILEARAAEGRIGRILGARHGIDGIDANDFVDLRVPSDEMLEEIARTPSSALGSCRRKPNVAECDTLLDKMIALGVGYFFYIGGNDSADTTRIIAERAMERNVSIRVGHIPKTIDCDLLENDHTPGYGSAARFVACAFRGDDLDNRALGGVKIDVVMGRDAGFLTAASALARIRPDDGPHLIYLPEKPFSVDAFCKDVKDALATFGRCVVAVSEGIRDENGRTIAERFATEHDSHGNLQLSGTGALGDYLARCVREKTGVKRVRADTFGYLQRSFPGIASETDSFEARAVGREAVRYVLSTPENTPPVTIAIRRNPGAQYAVSFVPAPVQAVAKNTRSLPKEFLAPDRPDVTLDFLQFARPLVGTLPFCQVL